MRRVLYKKGSLTLISDPFRISGIFKSKLFNRIFPVYILLFCLCPASVPLCLFFKTLNLYLTDSVTVLVENSL